ncbi:hypothetical protein M5X00_25800 [Paenibacillus alvei]|uniref:hypothetical protein n=1 Tax=Paenibacillus alvei TaxID=44250 RepID=UPI000287E31F|nr:hypothetical protein [Paenibacillus alvei]EJW13979.1 hypothetical protein PAV_141p00850 [Paenibacillus alvei DSM 29]MCY9545215.1 hypothetical protein [Paenibacillus alvei]MCY9707659.1 hypothetical protein [Paenibacillus alvei]MCY9757644.1 hypothetical protein [Paenibacillus alvei]MEC0082829.1 hypothetical protein [Paenibacillus alvei]
MNQEIEFVDIRVGKKFPLFSESLEKMKGIDGAFFEAIDFNQGYYFCIHLTNIDFMDKHTFRNEKISVRVLQGDGGMVLPIIKFGRSMIFDINFDPTLYGDHRAFQLVDTNNILTIFLIESNNGELKAIRQCNLPLKMIQICREAWGRAVLDVGFSDKFNEWINRLSRYSLQSLWDRATKVGEMGETFDLQEIKTPNQYKPQEDIL